MIERKKEGIAVFIDYSDLHDTIIERTDYPDQAHREVISLVLTSLKRYESRGLTIRRTAAYADFSQYAGQAGEVEHLLYANGLSPRFVSCLHQATASEVQLTADAVDLLHRDPHVSTFLVVAGTRSYFPLLQLLRRSGREARVVLFGAESAAAEHPALKGLAEEASSLMSGARTPSATNGTREPLSVAPLNGHIESSRGNEGSAPLTYEDITDPVCVDALELIIDSFGQYEEIYLTPLLRKMSENMNEDDYDPKTVISELEEAGAVWLEKRHGVPYDYTVLILDDQHPDVQRIRREAPPSRREPAPAAFAVPTHR